MTLFPRPRGAFRVRVIDEGGPRDLGRYCVQLWVNFYGFFHVARHTTRASAEKHAKRLRAALRGEA